MGENQPSIEVLVERIGNVQATVTDIRSTMATKSDHGNTHDLIGRIEVALAQEVTARTAAVQAVANRLQLVEDRLEARKYQFGASILLAVIGAIVGVFL
jgi:glyceraldehyde-3-phosphate dehydrogenase/erythrose-4-phosphate dehydrogenase